MAAKQMQQNKEKSWRTAWFILHNNYDVGENLFFQQDTDLKHTEKTTPKQDKCSAWVDLPKKNGAKLQRPDVAIFIGEC